MAYQWLFLLLLLKDHARCKEKHKETHTHKATNTRTQDHTKKGLTVCAMLRSWFIVSLEGPRGIQIMTSTGQERGGN